jgi:hypothetical protein
VPFAIVKVRVALPNNEFGVGSGAIVEWEGQHVVLTAAHVVGDATHAELTFSNGEVYTFKIAGRDPLWDIAAIPIPLTNYKPIQLSEQDPRIGDCIQMIGYPGGGKVRSQTTRIVRYLEPDGASGDYWLEGSGRSIRGESGGPILSCTSRKLVGLCSGGDVAGPMVSRIRMFLPGVCDPPRMAPMTPAPPPIEPPLIQPVRYDELAELRKEIAELKRTIAKGFSVEVTQDGEVVGTATVTPHGGVLRLDLTSIGNTTRKER